MRGGRWLILGLAVVAVALAIVGLGHLLHGGRSPQASGASPSTSGSDTPRQGGVTVRPSLVTAAHWQHTSQGYWLRVTPSSYGRRRASGEPTQALRQAIAAAGQVPLQLTASQRSALTRQLRCHAEFATIKPRWDLESWRPDVSYIQTVVALCNP